MYESALAADYFGDEKLLVLFLLSQLFLKIQLLLSWILDCNSEVFDRQFNILTARKIAVRLVGIVWHFVRDAVVEYVL